MNSVSIKTILAILFCVISLSSGKSYAANQVAGSLEPTQILNNIVLLASDIAAYANEANTYLLQVKQTILDPIGDGLITMAQLQSADSITNMITGNNGQGNSLILSDPQKYFENKGLVIVKQSLGTVSGQNGLYTDNIYGSILSNFAQKSLESELKAINQSNVPSLIQKDICNEATLVTLAQQDVVAGGGLASNTTAVTARKQGLYNSLCVGNPTTDIALAKTLLSVQNQRPEVGGWDTWLAITGGDNAYNKAIQANTVVGKYATQNIEIAKTDYTMGRGVISQTECLEYAKNPNGDAMTSTQTAANCFKSFITNPSGLLSDSLTKSANAGLDRLTTIQGDSGWGSAASLITSVKGILKGYNQLKTTVDGIDTSIGRITGDGVTNYNNNPTVVTIATTPKNNLQNDPQGKASIVGPITKLIVNNLDIINQLDEASRNQLALIGPYEARTRAMKACYDEVDPGNTQAQAAYNTRMIGINEANTTIAKNFESVSTVKKISQDTISAMDASFSSEEITSIFGTYQNKMATSNIPDFRVVATYKGQYVKDKSKIDGDSGPSGELTQLQTQCEQLRAKKNGGGGDYSGG